MEIFFYIGIRLHLHKQQQKCDLPACNMKRKLVLATLISDRWNAPNYHKVWLDSWPLALWKDMARNVSSLLKVDKSDYFMILSIYYFMVSWILLCAFSMRTDLWPILGYKQTPFYWFSRFILIIRSSQSATNDFPRYYTTYNSFSFSFSVFLCFT